MPNLISKEPSLECKNFLNNQKNTGQLLHKFLRYVKFNGFTGRIEFIGNTFRQNFKIDIVQMTTNSEMSAVSINASLYIKQSWKKGNLNSKQHGISVFLCIFKNSIFFRILHVNNLL